MKQYIIMDYFLKSLVIVGLVTIITTIVSARNVKHSHKHHKNPSTNNLRNNFDIDEDYQTDNKISRQHHKSHTANARGLLSNLLTPVTSLATLGKDLWELKPITALEDLAAAYGTAFADTVSKLGDLGAVLQTNIRNLGADEMNDLFRAADKPIKYLLYTQKNKKEPVIMNKNGTVDEEFWDKTQKLKIIIHGFSPDSVTGANETQNMLGQLTIKNSYLDTGSLDNIIVADWTSLTRTLNYLGAAASTRIAGADVGQFVVNLHTTGFIPSLDDVHIIGFSLGAHVSGVAGNFIQNLTSGDKIGRITGLDPAGPLFDTINEKVPSDTRYVLDRSDAKFVDIIHCNTGFKGVMIPTKLGMASISGSADFFPNGAVEQPNCGTPYIPGFLDPFGFLQYISCSHSRCWMLYSESIGSKKYVACKCGTWEEFKAGKCDKACKKADKVYMGDLCPRTARGAYYLNANIDLPHNDTYVL